MYDNQDVRDYFAAKKAAEDKQTATQQAAREEFTKLTVGRNYSFNDPDIAAGQKKYDRVQSVSEQIWEAEIELAVAALRLSEDKLVQFILDEAVRQESMEHADVILEELPLDYAGLRKLGRDRGWCGDYSRALNRAVTAGVVENDTTPERTALEEYLGGVVSRTSYVQRAHELVDALVNAEVKKALEKAAATA